MTSRCCCEVLQRLVDEGHSLLVIEHNIEVIKCADWVIDLGPEAGDAGGIVVAEGTPEEVARVEESHTGHYLRGALAGDRRAWRAAECAESARSGSLAPMRRSGRMAIRFAGRASTISRTSRSRFRATRWWWSPG